MKITKIECIPITITYKKARHEHGNAKPGKQEVFVKMHTDEGIIGYGESGTCSLGYTGDSVESVIGFIRFVGPKILIGEDPFNIEKITAEMSRAVKYCYQGQMVIDSCLHDIVGKKLGIPLYQYLGGLSNPKIAMCWVLGYGTWVTPDEAGERAKNAVAEGYKSIKLKVSRDPLGLDIENIKAIRAAVGYDIKLAIDANAGWNYFQALEALKKMEKYDIMLAEQPVPYKEIDNLARLRQKVGIPICADESATDLNHLLEMIEKDAVDLLFIKLAKCGGIRRGQKWVAIAEAAGIPVMMGCMTGTGFETAYQAHFLAAVEWMGVMEQENLGVAIIHDQYETVKKPITDDLAKNPPRIENGFQYAPDGPGLGVELNEKVLAEITTKGMSPLVVGK